MYLSTILAAESSSGGGAAIAQLGILLLIPLAMYFLMIRPQRRRMRDQASMQSALEVGDEVITTSGMYGFITGFDEDRIWVEIDDDVQVRVNKGAIQGKVDTGASSGDAKPDAAAAKTIESRSATVSSSDVIGSDAAPSDAITFDAGSNDARSDSGTRDPAG